ncbi:MAG: TIGR00730 family Rossman fold protein [Polyangiaceae bacterium]
MKSVAVFCGSNRGRSPAFAEGAAALGGAIARRGARVVYGGGNVGLMGVLADAALAAGGQVIGVIPEALVARELAHKGCTELHVVTSMHDRKALMADLADGFVMLPGGFGTYDEFCEIVTWAQLGIHAKPCGVLDLAMESGVGFFRALLEHFDVATREGFVHESHRRMILEAATPDALLDAMDAYEPTFAAKWIDR